MREELSKIKVALDLDGTITDVHSFIKNDVYCRFGISFDWDESDLSKLSIPKKALSFIKSKCFGNPSYMNSIPPTEDALEQIERLKGLSEVEKVYIVTGRSSSPVMVAHTEAWVEEYFGKLIDGVFFSGYKKGKFLKDLGVDIYVEDMLEQAMEVCEHDITCFLINKPYNHSKECFNDLLKRRDSLKSCIDDIVINCAFRGAIRIERR